MIHRRNPMPMSGAIFLTNGKKRRNGKRHSKKHGAHGRVIARFNRSRKRRNGLAVRTNGLAVRTNRKRRNGLAVRTNRKRRNGLAVRTNGLAVRTNGKRRRNGLAVRTNRRRRNPSGGLSLNAIFSPVAKILNKIPGGKMITPYLAPAAFGALGLLGVHMGLKYGAKYIPTMIKGFVTPVGYTLGGLVLGALVQFVPGIAKNDKKALAAAMIVGGAGVDAFRKLTGSSTLGDEYGEGGLWQLGGDELGGEMAMSYHDADAAALGSEYADAEMADAYYSGADLDAVEGEAALAGPKNWRRRFPATRRASGAKTACSRHAQKHGHRWAWLCKLVGFQNFQAIVALPAEQRVAYIAQLRQQAISSIPGGSYPRSAELSMNMPSGQTSVVEGYGATMYAGGGAGAAF
jgi:hypothetical protein